MTDPKMLEAARAKREAEFPGPVDKVRITLNADDYELELAEFASEQVRERTRGIEKYLARIIESRNVPQHLQTEAKQWLVELYDREAVNVTEGEG